VSQVIHRKHFGATTGLTPQETHIKYAWRSRQCIVAGCGGTPNIRIRVFTPIKEMDQGILAAIAASNRDSPGSLPVVQMTYGAMLKTADMVVCRSHQKDAERAAARGPSCSLVEIDRGPDPTNKTQVGWTGDAETK
jgi:hypothetical protein